MEYLVLEIKPDPSATANDAKVFKSIADAVKYIQKMSNSKKLIIKEKDKNIDQLAWILTERLSSVAIATEREERNHWVITAF
jgi:hypothetical protein